MNDPSPGRCDATRQVPTGSSPEHPEEGQRPQIPPAAANLRPVSFDVAIIGCGRVGLSLALAFADQGLRTIGIDTDSERLDAVQSGPDAVRRTAGRQLTGVYRRGDS